MAIHFVWTYANVHESNNEAEDVDLEYIRQSGNVPLHLSTVRRSDGMEVNSKPAYRCWFVGCVYTDSGHILATYKNPEEYEKAREKYVEDSTL